MSKKHITENLSSEMMANIDSYGSKIQVITDDMERVRKRPGMYIGPRESAGFLNMIREVFQNSLDQLLSEVSPCNLITIIYDLRTETVSITDNGMGIPFDNMINVYTVLHSSKNFEKKKGDYSAGLNGVGAKATNALSDYFNVTSYHYSGVAREIVFERGKIISDKKVQNKNKLQGTKVVFRPDRDIMGDTSLEPERLFYLIKNMLSLTKLGSRVDFTVIDINGKVSTTNIINENGILTNLYDKCSNMVIQPIIISYDNGDMKLDAAFTFDGKNIEGENITAFANMCPTSISPLNTHVSGFVDGVTLWFSKYMNSVYLSEKSKVKIISNDIKAGLSAMISAFHLNPDFTGQAKEQFSNSDYKPFAKSVVMTSLDEWSKNKPQDLQKVCKFLKDIADIRNRAENEKVKFTKTYATSIAGLPAKYRKPTGPSSGGWELFIVEGDSAKSTASQGRNPATQGIYPIRGKILNAFEATAQAIANNEEIMGIKDILNAGFGKTFDVSKVKFSKIIILTDADSDGRHIAALLLLLFLKCFPGLIENGLVFKAVPPLYGIRKDKKKPIFFSDRIDFTRYLQRKFYSNNTLTDINNKPISPSVFEKILLNNEDYAYDTQAIVDRFKIDPDLLELILESHINKDSYIKLRNKIVSRYRFMKNENIVKNGDIITIQGPIRDRVQTVIYDERFIAVCHKLIPYIQSALLDGKYKFKLNGQEIGLYTLISYTETFEANIERYKGLGEMSGKDLGISTMDPANRTLIQYSTNDIYKDIETIRTYQSDKKKILARITKIRRIDLVE